MEKKVIDNFLPNYQFDQLQSLLMSNEFDWYYNDGISYEGDAFYQFIHLFYSGNPSPTGRVYRPTQTFHWIEPYLSFFNMKKIYRIKSNLTTGTVSHHKAGYHIDNVPCSTTAILYMNTCNGGTEFKKGGIIKSVANRAVIFDPTLEHRSVTCTDKKRRIVINFNYDV